MREFIIESALLTHGLKSIGSERLKQELDKIGYRISTARGDFK